MQNGRRLVYLTLGFLLTVLPSSRIAVAQNPPAGGGVPKADSRTPAKVLVQVTGEVTKPQAISADDFAKLPRKTLRAKAHDGVEHQYEGVALVDVLATAGIPTEKNLRGLALALYVTVEASDNYRAVFSLAELDRSITDRVTLLADRRDGQPLTARDGPLLVVVPGEKKHARWVKQVVRLKVGRG
jgi:DMSO/TMAO reductase YedYZ molybdopterin-dependent catalytic subunit